MSTCFFFVCNKQLSGGKNGNSGIRHLKIKPLRHHRFA